MRIVFLLLAIFPYPLLKAQTVELRVTEFIYNPNNTLGASGAIEFTVELKAGENYYNGGVSSNYSNGSIRFTPTFDSGVNVDITNSTAENLAGSAFAITTLAPQFTTMPLIAIRPSRDVAQTNKDLSETIFIKLAKITIPVTSGTPTVNGTYLTFKSNLSSLNGSVWVKYGVAGNLPYLAVDADAPNVYYMTDPGFEWKGNGSGNESTKNLWSIDANWVGGKAPTTADTDAVIKYHPDAIDLHVDNTYTVSSISNSTTAGLIILSGKSLTLTNWDDSDNVTSGGGGILIKSESATEPNGTFIAPTGKTITASVEFSTKALSSDVSSTNLRKWQFFGIPVKECTGSTFYTGNEDHSVKIRKFGHTDVSSNTVGNTTTTTYKSWWDISSSDKMTALHGYEISTADTHSTGVFTITGELITNDQTFTVERVSKDRFEGEWLLSNPFTGAIDIEDITFGTGGEFQQSIYLYNTGSMKDYKDGNNGAVTKTDTPGQYTVLAPYTNGGIIPSMQGFVVKLNNGVNQGTITLPYSSARKNTVRLKNVKTEPIEKIYTNIHLLSDGIMKDQAWIYTDSRTTRNFDNGWDGHKMFGGSTLAQLYIPEEDGNYQVNAVPDMNNTFLNMKAQEGINNYTLSFTHSNIDNTYAQIILVDLKTNEEKDITTGGEYHFTANNTTVAETRFLIRTTATTPGKETNVNNVNMTDTRVNVYANNGLLHITNGLEEDAQVTLYTISGQLLYKFRVGSQTTQSIPAIHCPKGVFVVKINTPDGHKLSTKVIL